MSEGRFARSQVVARSLEDAFDFFADPHNLELITPPWLRFRIEHAPLHLAEGALIDYRLSLFRVPFRWQTRIVEWSPPHGFVDEQRHGPFRTWVHRHTLDAMGSARTRIGDEVLWAAPGGPLAGLLVARWVRRIFDYRAERLAALLDRDPPG